jgi:hypothetical protein
MTTRRTGVMPYGRVRKLSVRHSATLRVGLSAPATRRPTSHNRGARLSPRAVSIYSSRSASIGSRREARSAGT